MKLITIDLSKKQPLDVNTKAKEQINSTANLEQLGNTSMSFSIEEAKETIIDFSQGTVNLFFFNIKLLNITL